MTVQAQHSLGRSVDQGQEQSAMAAEPRINLGVRVPPPPINLERILSASTMKEWWSLLRASVGPELSQLHWDILSFCKMYELTPQQIQLRRDAMACVERAVHEIWPSAETYLFGSTATGLALPWSDIDVVIMPPKHLDRAWQKPTPLSWQNALSRKLNRLGQCRSLHKIPFAKVPLLKVVFNSGIACDISFDVRNSHAGVSVIRQFMEQYEACRPLCLLLKFFLGQNNLNELHTGGLGSFCIITMVISHLQKSAAIAEAGRGDLGSLLLSFFAHYSNMHNYSTDVVSTRPDFCGSKQDKGWVNQKNPQLLAVEDPLDPTSDIGKGSHKIEQVRHKFAVAQRALLTYWHNEHVLAQIVDMIANPNQRPATPSPEKSKPSKRGGRKRRRSSSGQDEYILTQQPAQKIQRRHHPQQGSGLVTKRQLDRVMANDGGPHFTSGLVPPISKRFGKGFDEENFHSVGNFYPTKTPALQDCDLSRRAQGNARRSYSLEANSSPKMKPRNSASKHQAAADFSRAQEDSSKGSHFMQANDSTLRIKQKKIQNHQASEGDCRPVQFVHSHRRHEGMDALGNREIQDGKINFEFWESQLTTRSKPRKTSLKQEGNAARCRDLSRSQDSTTGSGFLETNSTPIIRPIRKTLKHQTKKEDRPMQSGHSHLTQEGLDGGVTRGNQDERILVDFWESHLTIPSKPRESSLRIPGAGVNDKSSHAKPTLHHEPPQKSSKTQPNVQDEKLLQHHGAGGNNKQAQIERAQHGSQLLPNTQDVEKVENCDTSGNTKPDQAVQIVHREQSQNGCKLQPATQDRKPFEHCGTGSSNELAQAAQISHPERFQNGSKRQPSTQDETLVVDLDFWEAQLTTKPKSKSDFLSIRQSSRGLGKDGQPAVAIRSEEPAQAKDAVGGVQDKGIVVEILEPPLTTQRKPRSDSLQQHGLGEKYDQTALRIHHEQPPQGKDLAQEVQEEGISLDFWEAQLDPRPKPQKGTLGNQHTPGGAMGDLPRLTSSKISSMNDINEGEHGGVLPKDMNHFDRPQHDRDVTGNGDEKLLVDFWESQLAPRLKAGKCSSKQLAAGCEGEDAQPEQSLLEQQEPPQSSEVLQKCPDERKLVDFWETHLNPKAKLKDPLNGQQSAGGGDEVEDADKCNDHGYDRILVDFWEAHLTPSLKSRKGALTQDGIADEEDIQSVQKTHRELPTLGGEVLQVSPEEKKLVDFWETHLNPKAKSKKDHLNDQQAARSGDEVEDAEKCNDHGYDRTLVDFWETHLTPNVKSRKGALTHLGIAAEEDIQAVQKTHRELPTQGGAVMGRSEDEAILSTFWEACLYPAFSRKGYLRRKSTAVI